MNVSEFIAQFLAEAGIRHVFMLTGGGAMHLNNALGKHPKLQAIFNHHEQASAMAAESYARLSNQMAVVNVTTGPGGINTLNGVFGAWTDSIPMLVISGQVRYDTTIHSTKFNLRQLGDQEADIIPSVKPMTKYAEMVIDPQLIKYHLQKALYIATHGRPGPVWLDIPMNVQGATIDETRLIDYNPKIEFPHQPTIHPKTITNVIEQLKRAERPVILAGSGVRISGSHDLFLQLVDKLQIPVTTGWNAHDVIYDEHPCYIGRQGLLGDRAGNFAVQNSDLLLALGSRLSIRQVGYSWKTFAREAFKIAVDIDPLELIKPTIQLDMPIHADLSAFLTQLLAAVDKTSLPKRSSWLNWCMERRKRYPVVLKEYWDRKQLVNPYCFMHALSDLLPENQIVVCADGSACVVGFQAFQLKKGQRLYHNSGCASMGYDLPAAIGACIASGGKEIICLAGDGSIQQNIQELATIIHHQYPIKIFMLISFNSTNTK
jgi:acetolactate synthase-1/2/3 large subunit